MADPTTYSPGYSFTGYQGTAPDDPLPADQLDAELVSIAAKITALVAAVKDVRRSDGALKNAIVTLDALSTDVLTAVSDWNPRGDWVTATSFALKDFVTESSVLYVCIVPHTSGTFATDLTAGYWMAVGSFADAAGVAFTAAGDIAATDVQAAIEELDAEKQPLDAELTAIAGLTSAADKLAYFTGSGTAALATLTAAARTLLAGASMTAIMASLGCLPLAGGTLTGKLTLSGTEAAGADAASRSYADGVAANSSTMGPPGGRLTLTSGISVTTSDVTGGTSIYYTPHVNDLLPLYDGTVWAVKQFTELELVLDSDSGHTGYHQNGKCFDVYVFDDSGTLRLGSSPMWTDVNNRGAANDIARLNGRWTNAASLQLRFGSASGSLVTVAAGEALYVGTFLTTSDGATSDSLLYRHLWNTYNRAPRAIRSLDTTDSWTYSTATWRLANNSANSILGFVRGLDEDAVSAQVMASVSNDTATPRAVFVAVGVSSASAPSGSRTVAMCTSAVYGAPHGAYHGFPGLGYQYVSWLEMGTGVDIQTWYGDNGSTTNLQSGISGVVLA